MNPLVSILERVGSHDGIDYHVVQLPTGKFSFALVEKGAVNVSVSNFASHGLAKVSAEILIEAVKSVNCI